MRIKNPVVVLAGVVLMALTLSASAQDLLHVRPDRGILE